MPKIFNGTKSATTKARERLDAILAGLVLLGVVLGLSV